MVYETELKELEQCYEWLEACTFGTKEQPLEDWKLVEDKDGFAVHKHKHHTHTLIKGHSLVHASVDEILQCLSDMTFDMRKRWDQQCVAMRELERFGGSRFGDYKVIGYTKFPSPTPLFSARDFVFIANVKRRDDYVMLNSCSIQDNEDKYPANHGVVRAVIPICGWVVKPHITPGTAKGSDGFIGAISDFCEDLIDRSENRCCDVWYTSQIDLKGWVPAWLHNYTAMTMVNCVPRFKQLIEKMSADNLAKLAKSQNTHHNQHHSHYHHPNNAHQTTNAL